MFPKSLTWNTKRGYSPQGQTIVAEFIPRAIDDNGDQVGAIEFVDVTRGIDGRFDDVRFTNREIPDNVFETVVLSRYDDGGYRSTKFLKLELAGGGTYRAVRQGVPVDGHTWNGGLYDTGPTDAIDEAIVGDHVAHVRNPANDRVVAIRPKRIPYPNPDFRIDFELTFSDPKVDLRKHGGNEQVFETVKEADKAIRNFLVGIRACQSVDYFQDFINQKERDCEIVRLTKTRARIRYWLPKSGETKAWRAFTQVGTYLYLRGV